jgi:DNA polymerase (family 10)
MDNRKIASFFKTLADLLEIKGENPFRIRAYRNAARTIETSGYDFVRLVEEGADLSRLPDIGERIAKKITEIVTTGRLRKLEELKKEFPPHILDLLRIEGIGPKRARILYKELGIGSLDELKKAAETGRIRTLPGFSEKLEAKILKGVSLYKKEGIRFLYAAVEGRAREIEAYLRRCKAIDKITVAGSFRRRKETVGDLDILITSDDPPEAMDHFTAYPKISEIVSKGPTRSTVLLDNGLQIDLRRVDNRSYGAALHYFTGSKAHNIAVRKMAQERGWKVNEYGVYDEKMLPIAGETEEEIYRLFGMAYIEPELREDRGELEAARKGALPELVGFDDLRGDLHCYSDFSLGGDSCETMVQRAIGLGYRFLAITDRLDHLSSSHGRKCAPLEEYLSTLEELQTRYPELRILKGAEVGFDAKGDLESAGIDLGCFDLVIASADDPLGLDREEQTRRHLRALSHPAVTILAHPTGRIISRRNAFDMDLRRVMEAAVDHGVFLEIDSRPDRLDLGDAHILRAKKLGARFALGSCAVSAGEMEQIRYGLYQARRGWLEAPDLLNTFMETSLNGHPGKRRASNGGKRL